VGLTVGDAEVGRIVGMAVGLEGIIVGFDDTVGGRVQFGEYVGFFETLGAIEGISVGRAEVGMNVGRNVGKYVDGVVVGVHVGFVDGTNVDGLSVVGVKLVKLVGQYVGLLLGSTVGDMVDSEGQDVNATAFGVPVGRSEGDALGREVRNSLGSLVELVCNPRSFENLNAGICMQACELSARVDSYLLQFSPVYLSN
jgi:hypothetical protein